MIVRFVVVGIAMAGLLLRPASGPSADTGPQYHRFQGGVVLFDAPTSRHLHDGSLVSEGRSCVLGETAETNEEEASDKHVDGVHRVAGPFFSLLSRASGHSRVPNGDELAVLHTVKILC